MSKPPLVVIDAQEKNDGQAYQLEFHCGSEAPQEAKDLVGRIVYRVHPFTYPKFRGKFSKYAEIQRVIDWLPPFTP